MLSAIKRSLRYKVMAVVMAAALAGLLFSAAALLTYEIRRYRSQLATDMATQAGIVARMSAPALAFDDAEAGRANLALLDTRPDILSAAIYAPDGSTFATYNRADVEPRFPPITRVGVPQVGGGELTLFQPIVEEGNLLGTVYLRARDDLVSRLQDYALILGGVLLISLLVAALVSLLLQRGVTGSLQSIVAVARRVIKERDFTLRAHKTSADEIGVLVDAFNGMLAEIGAHQSALEESNRQLRVESDERRNAEQALRAADKKKDEFLATLAHELRNPLAPMVNSLGLLKTGGANEATTERAYEIMDRQLAHMVRLIEDLVDVSRITRGKLALRREPIELAATIDAAVDAVRPHVERRRQRLTVDAPAAPIHLHADPVRVSQVLSNLLNNATKYAPEQGHIRVTVGIGRNSARIEVSDDGWGIEPDEVPEIFEMFSQIDASAERVYSGLGVGLALAKRLVELHGGTLEAESAGRGQGSTFTVTLPVAQAAAPALRQATDAPAERAKRVRILLVDDNVDFVTSLEILLGSLGHQVRVAHDAPAALSEARAFDPEIAFLDIGLPTINGYELAGRLREVSSATVLVALSGWGQERDRHRAREAGFEMHLVKPVELDSIRSALDTLLAQEG